MIGVRPAAGEVSALGVDARGGFVRLAIEILGDQRRQREHALAGADGLPEGAAAEDEVAGVDPHGHLEQARRQAVDGPFDAVHGRLGVGPAGGAERLLVLLAAVAEAGNIEIALLAQVRHDSLAWSGRSD